MNIIFFRWNVVNENRIAEALKLLGHRVFDCSDNLNDYSFDASAMQKLLMQIHKCKADMLFSVDYIPLLALVADTAHINYYSWVQDAPNFTMYSDTMKLAVNHCYMFDREEAGAMRQMGNDRVLYYPLASDPVFFNNVIRLCEGKESDKYADEVSFVGSVYGHGKNEAAYESLSDYDRGYCESLMNAQQLIYGGNIIEECMDSDLADRIVAAAGVSFSGEYNFDSRRVACYYLEKQLTGKERYDFLTAVAAHFSLSVYSGDKSVDIPKAQIKGFADYETVMPLIFYRSKINLHFAPRFIHDGVSLRVMDVLACGGFLVTSYHKGIEGLFNDEHLVTFSSEEELLDKIDFYLKNEDARVKISAAGRRIVEEKYTYAKALETILA